MLFTQSTKAENGKITDLFGGQMNVEREVRACISAVSAALAAMVARASAQIIESSM